MKETRLNEMELAVLTAVKEEIISCTRSEFCFGGDVKVVGLSEKQLYGYLSQLSQKGYTYTQEDWDGLTYLTKKGAHTLGITEGFDLMD